jgi:hypothetical protein
MWVPTWAFLLNLMNMGSGHGTDTTKVLGNASVGLLRSPYVPSPGSLASDSAFAECNYNGYARKVLPTPSAAYIGQTQFSLFASGDLVFTPAGSDTVNTVYGQFLIGSGNALLAVEMFNQPIPLPGPSYSLVSTIMFGANAFVSWANSLVSN